MFGKPLQIRWVAVTAALTLGVLLFANVLYQEQAKAAPLERALETVPGVTAVQVQREDGRWRVRVQLGAVDLLPATYQALRERADRHLGPGRYELELVDRRTPELEKAFYEVSYFVEEGRSRGDYARAAQQVAAAGRRLGLDRARLYVDAEFLYLELARGDGVLYAVMPLRPPQEVTGR
ncbi:hypothetical protein [Thermaerobacter composti]|uniref:Uncharacterized protein n=1 Tax=Thermaerobacter composti TaxID=554949 RepID=A0ABZ0QRC3_9FIRM|nr:hypothetical protein [Thermaerobacter composti]WPD20039.1 hypothetical protein Q5761_05210 [Thermaerobacter composti]